MTHPGREPDDLDRYMAKLSEADRAEVAAAELAIDLAFALHDARASRHLTQADVAELLGSSQQAVSRIERPGGNVTIQTLRKYLDVLGYSLEIRITDAATGLLVEHLSSAPSVARHSRSASGR